MPAFDDLETQTIETKLGGAFDDLDLEPKERKPKESFQGKDLEPYGGIATKYGLGALKSLSSLLPFTPIGHGKEAQTTPMIPALSTIIGTIKNPKETWSAEQWLPSAVDLAVGAGLGYGGVKGGLKAIKGERIAPIPPERLTQIERIPFEQIKEKIRRTELPPVKPSPFEQRLAGLRERLTKEPISPEPPPITKAPAKKPALGEAELQMKKRLEAKGVGKPAPTGKGKIHPFRSLEEELAETYGQEFQAENAITYILPRFPQIKGTDLRVVKKGKWWQIEYKPTIKPAPTEVAGVPTTKISPQKNAQLKEMAEYSISQVKAGKPGERTFVYPEPEEKTTAPRVFAEPSTYPQWYRDLTTGYGIKKSQVIKALGEIKEKGKEADGRKYVEAIKGSLLDQLTEERQQIAHDILKKRAEAKQLTANEKELLTYFEEKAKEGQPKPLVLTEQVLPKAPAKQGELPTLQKQLAEGEMAKPITKVTGTKAIKEEMYGRPEPEVLPGQMEMGKAEAPKGVPAKKGLKRLLTEETGSATLPTPEDVARILEKIKGIFPDVKDFVDRNFEDLKVWGVGKSEKELKEAVYFGGLAKEKKIAQVNEVQAQETSVQTVWDALKEIKPLRGEQEALYTQERGRRMAKAQAVGFKTKGEAGYYKRIGQFKGEMPKIDVIYIESLRDKVSQTHVDNLFNMVQDASVLTEWEKLPAGEGLRKLFDGELPTESELGLLAQVFPSGFIEEMLTKRPLWQKVRDAGLQIVNIPRSMMASFDLSFGGRQGAFAAPRYRKEFFNSWTKQFKIFGSEKAYKASREALIADPDFLFAKQSGISFTDLGSLMKFREERFASSWAERAPKWTAPFWLASKGVRASNRAYTSFANKFRLDIFKSMVKDYETMGIDVRSKPLMARKTAELVNNLTGRGTTSYGQWGYLANAFLWSPRLMASRLHLLNPGYYITQPKFVRAQSLKTLLTATGTATTVLGLAKLMGADVEVDPVSADFGKVKIGNTRVDVLAGFGQYIRLTAQTLPHFMGGGRYKSSVTGKVVELGKGYKPLTRKELWYRFGEYKEAPVFSFVTGLLGSTEYRPFNLPKEIGNRFVPMVIGDMIDIARDDPRLLPLSTLGVFGVGLQTYKKEPFAFRKQRSWR